MSGVLVTVRAAGTLDLTVHARAVDAPTRTVLSGATRYRVGGGTRSLGPGSTAGATVCGRPMLLEELWCPHRPEPRDPRCPRCFTARGRIRARARTR